jgi:1-pyrroline-5-carboxylate dehydrogenase
MRERKFELAAWEVYEVGKTWVEADGDVAEAIDFLEYYGREMIRLSSPPKLTPYPGEAAQLIYIPLGVGLVIPPWNFPLAILVGTTSASFVTGNAVILKPSSDAPMIATRFMEILEEVGLPQGVVNLLTGPGGEVGNYLVGHPKVRFINFTGSKEVGLQIVERAATTAPGQIWIKRVVAEMGGKDAIIVDDEADLNDALLGVVSSAFGFQGQKCSACSRAIVLDPIYDKFLEGLVERTSRLRVDMPKNPEADLGPVINERAFRSILEYIELGKAEGRLLCGGEPAHFLQSGYFIKPTIFADVKPEARIAQEEIFGPVLSVIKARDFDEAIRIANSTVYGLTGSVYT